MLAWVLHKKLIHPYKDPACPTGEAVVQVLNAMQNTQITRAECSRPLSGPVTPGATSSGHDITGAPRKKKSGVLTPGAEAPASQCLPVARGCGWK